MIINNRITSIEFSRGGLDFGIYNNHLYCIDSDGRIWIRYIENKPRKLSIENREKNLFQNLNWICIGEVASLPIDSLVYKNNLIIITENTIDLIRLSSSNDIVEHSSAASHGAFAIARYKNMLALSCGENGTVWIELGRNQQKSLVEKTPASRIIFGENYFIRMFHETTPDIGLLDPKLLGNINISEHISQNALVKSAHFVNHEFYLSDEIENNALKATDILGDDVRFTYSDGRIVCLSLNDNTGWLFNGKGKLNGKISQNVFDRNLAFFTYYDGFNHMLPLPNIRTEEPKKLADRFTRKPIALHYHPLGVIEEYLNSVVFINKYGFRTKLIENQEVAQVRTFPTSAYPYHIAVATESGCWLFIIDRDPIDWPIVEVI